MRIKLSFQYVITFLLLLIVMLELHEIVHITVGRLICGCWGARDFNVWSLCASCEGSQLSWLATIAGPVFSFVLMWVGMFWLGSAKSGRKEFGFSLIFANIPFGRITTVAMGGGDEMVVTKYFLKGYFGRTAMVTLCSSIVLAIVLPPVIRAFKILANKNRWLYISGFLTLPLLFLLLYVLTAMNGLLNRGFLSTPWIMGTPLLITLHTAIALALLIMLRKKLLGINSAR